MDAVIAVHSDLLNELHFISWIRQKNWIWLAGLPCLALKLCMSHRSAYLFCWPMLLFHGRVLGLVHTAGMRIDLGPMNKNGRRGEVGYIAVSPTKVQCFDMTSFWPNHVYWVNARPITTMQRLKGNQSHKWSRAKHTCRPTNHTLQFWKHLRRYLCAAA